jgi:hypothetical protein
MKRITAGFWLWLNAQLCILRPFLGRAKVLPVDDRRGRRIFIERDEPTSIDVHDVTASYQRAQQ